MSAIIKAFPPSRMVGRAKATAQVWLTKSRQVQRRHNLREMAEMTAAMELAGMGPHAIKQQLFAFNRLACDEFCRRQPPLTEGDGETSTMLSESAL